MLAARSSHLRSLVGAFLFLALVASGTALAQEDEADQGGSGATEAKVDAGTDADGGASGQKRKKKAVDDELPVCEDDGAGSKKAKKKSKKAEASAPEPGRDCLPPPRCGTNQVDLAPEADEPNCVDQRRLNQLIAGYEAAVAEEAAALEELSAALDTLDLLHDQLEATRVRLGQAQLRLASAVAAAGFAEIRSEIAAENLEDVAAALATEEALLRSQSVEAYMGGDEVELATQSAILNAQDYTSIELAKEYAGVAIDRQLTTVDDVQALRTAVEALGELITALEASAVADARRVAEIEAQLDELVGEQRSLVAEAEAEAAAVAERIADIQARKQGYAEELRVTGAGGGSIGDLLRTSQADQQSPDSPAGVFASPLRHTKIGSPFGPRVHPIFGDTRMHAGVDMSANAGEEILAAADGVVIIAEETGGYGNVVVVDHGNTLATLYAHMTASSVAVGQQVAQGDLLGYVGSTGYSTGPHLHFEVRVLGTPVDPLLYVRF